MDLGLKSKKVLVFGSSAGLGKATAVEFIKEGADVTIQGRNQKRLEKTQSEIKASGIIVGDLGVKDAAKNIVDEYIKKNSNLDVLVLNTGGPPKGNFDEISSDIWREQFENLWMSGVDAIKVAMPVFKKQKFGRVIWITSVAAKEAMKDLTVSNGFRAGILGLTRSLSNDFASSGVTFNQILPGFTNTERLQNLNLSEEFVRSVVPAGRIGEPEELGKLAAFLGSEVASYITGQAIAIDGGFLKGF